MKDPSHTFAYIVSANILLDKASQKVELRVKEWGRFPMVGKYHPAKPRGEGVGVKRERLGHFAIFYTSHSTLMLICQFCVINSQGKCWYDRDQKLFIVRI